MREKFIAKEENKEKDREVRERAKNCQKERLNYLRKLSTKRVRS